jgi:hypothetical protein
VEAAAAGAAVWVSPSLPTTSATWRNDRRMRPTAQRRSSKSQSRVGPPP